MFSDFRPWPWLLGYGRWLGRLSREAGVFLLFSCVFIVLSSEEACARSLRAGSTSLREKARHLAKQFPKESRTEAAFREHGIVFFADSKPKEVGDEEKFFVDKTDSGTRQQLSAFLRLIGVHCYVYVEKGQQVSGGKIAAVAKAFDDSVFPTNRSWFGSEWTPGIDGDP